jgi:hypothetical protein
MDTKVIIHVAFGYGFVYFLKSPQMLGELIGFQIFLMRKHRRTLTSEVMPLDISQCPSLILKIQRRMLNINQNGR